MGNRRFYAVSASCFLCALVYWGCSSDTTRPQGSSGQDDAFLEGLVFLAGDGERTNQIEVRVVDTSDDTEADTTFPNGDGYFKTRGLAAGSYTIVASAPTLDGFGQARRENVPLVAGQTRHLGTIDVPDTSRVRVVNVEPSPASFIIPRRPTIKGSFVSDGSGISRSSFSLQIDGVQVRQETVLRIDDHLRGGRFEYVPPSNFSPGDVTVVVGIGNRAGNTTSRSWTFNVLDGVQRRVPSEYANLRAAYDAANEGDTLMVAPGVHTVENLFVGKELVFLAEAILHKGGTPEMTVLQGAGNRHLRFDSDITRETRVQGFLLRGGLIANTADAGGSIRCNSCDVTIERCIFEDNFAGIGGAISINNHSAMLITDSVFRNNEALRGGAVGVFDESESIIERCVFVGNLASANGTDGGGGGAVFVQSGYPTIRHCTFYDNEAQRSGGAIMLVSDAASPASLVTSSYNVFARSRSPQGVVDINNQGRFDSQCDAFALVAEQGPVFTQTGNGGSFSLSNKVEVAAGVDPGFCDAAGGDLHLRAGAPLLAADCEPAPGALSVGCGGRRGWHWGGH